MKFLHVRHATSILTYGGLNILVDPVLADKAEYPHIPLTPFKRKNPLVGLSTPADKILEADIILSTHSHMDHFDAKAKQLLDKSKAIICQPNDKSIYISDGFTNVIAVEDAITCQAVTIIRVNAQHGAGKIGELMGASSGYILSADNEPTVYITGDTIFNENIKNNIEEYSPDILIINAGSPKFLNSGHIVMNILDIEETLKINPNLSFVIVHLDTFNHCIEAREDIREYFAPERLTDLGVKAFYVPDDNELLEL